ncbi:hypothetical protein PIROE2DRAFT_3574 [Piromyces sp. E2]|nr:hypothetical protein PIROE2DRAFT_3574 [Piromyces sp. E2]|eukprot:OUM68723.1 hypothetical protein PIROE2DRAFT_3574 [Piromyces sp. E2]
MKDHGFLKIALKKKDFFQQLDTILYNEDVPSYSFLNQIHNIEERINSICDVNVLNVKTNEMVYKFNESKTLEWLTKKVYII